MSDVVPKWAATELSAEMPTVRETGENSTVDFKEAFPEQAHRLGKEIAAMASSCGGRIFIGVNDNGDLCGLPIDTAKGRDDAAERAHNIARTVSPVPKITIEFAVESGHTVLVIGIPKQNAPVFYYDSRPYVRDERQARPAEPTEVVELVWSHPSSNHKLAMERIETQQMQNLIDRSDAQQRNHDETMNLISRGTLR